VSICQAKLFQSVLTCLVILAGVFGYQSFAAWQVEESLMQYHAATVQDAQQAIHDSLQNLGLFPIEGIVHEAPCIKKVTKKDTHANKADQCFPVYVNGRLQSDLATVRIIDLHHCGLISKGVESRSGGQVVVISKTEAFEDLYIEFDLLDEEQGSFRVNLPKEKQDLTAIERVFNQLVAEPRLSSREELDNLLYQLFVSAKLSKVSNHSAQQFMTLILSSVHYELSRQQVFN
tara:strand:- start:29621 stop:30316 length:696 start_codon:yes stop_codon:yes gene_type:complete